MKPNADTVQAVYLTFPDPETAGSTARALVERRLAACVNVLPPGRSVYRWKGEIVAEGEVVAIATTTKSRLVELTRVVQELHPYELPAVVAYPAEGGLEEYLEWVRAEVRVDPAGGTISFDAAVEDLRSDRDSH
jgi:periplasmic divalent cation tolerance protein